MLVDSHCHLDFPQLQGEEDMILANMARNGVSHALCIAVSVEGLPGVLAWAERHPNIFATVGVHPDHREGEEPDVERLLGLASHPRVVGIGETGLDYFRETGDLEWQRQRFRTHIRAARRCGKPLVVHTRDAARDTLRIMAEEGAAEVGGVMHCFTESMEVAEAAMAMNFLISFSGIVTFRNATAIREVARHVPLDRLLVETDSPYLAPVPHRGKVNQPAFVLHVAQEIARLRDLDAAAVARATTENFFRLFRILDR